MKTKEIKVDIKKELYEKIKQISISLNISKRFVYSIIMYNGLNRFIEEIENGEKKILNEDSYNQKHPNLGFVETGTAISALDILTETKLR